MRYLAKSVDVMKAELLAAFDEWCVGVHSSPAHVLTCVASALRGGTCGPCVMYSDTCCAV